MNYEQLQAILTAILMSGAYASGDYNQPRVDLFAEEAEEILETCGVNCSTK